MLSGCKDDEVNKEAEQKGWIKYDNKTYALTQAASTSQETGDDGFAGHEIVVRLTNEMKGQNKATDLTFGIYSEAVSLQGAAGVYTPRQESPAAGTVSNRKVRILLGGAPVDWPEIISDEQVEVTYEAGLYQIEGFFVLNEVKLEFYYKGNVDIQ